MSCFGSNCRSHVREWHYEDLPPDKQQKYMNLLNEYDQTNNGQTFFEFLQAKDNLIQEDLDRKYIEDLNKYRELFLAYENVYDNVTNRHLISPPPEPERIISTLVNFASLNVPDGTVVPDGMRGGKLHNHRRSHKRVRSKKSKKSRKYI